MLDLGREISRAPQAKFQVGDCEVTPGSCDVGVYTRAVCLHSIKANLSKKLLANMAPQNHQAFDGCTKLTPHVWVDDQARPLRTLSFRRVNFLLHLAPHVQVELTFASTQCENGAWHGLYLLLFPGVRLAIESKVSACVRLRCACWSQPGQTCMIFGPLDDMSDTY